jgi:serine/threonine protein kinase
MDTKGEVSGQVVVGRYEVIRPLGSGGMGKVFLVRDLETGEKRAMKIRSSGR